MKIKHHLTTTIVLSFLTLASCSEKKTNTSTTATSGGIEAILVSQEPESPQAIFAARKSAKPGDTITVSGKVMGRMDPFVEGRAIMVIGDPAKITSCDLKGDDHCETPWDVCCDDPDVIKASTITVQVIGEDGKLLKTGLKGTGGIKELSHVVVTGVVAEGSNKDNLLLNATAIYVKK